MRVLYYITLCCSLLLAAGCKQFKNPFAGEKPIAREGGQMLFLADVEPIFTPGLSKEDSLRVLESYVEIWVKKQLKVEEAEKLLPESQKRDIERMVEDYRHSLLSVRLDQYYVDRMLDTTITAEQVAQYYAEHRGDFILDRTIVKGDVVKVPGNFRQLARLKELMASSRPSDRQDLLDMCLKNQLSLQEFPQWTDLSEFAGQLPGNRLQQGEEWVKKTGVQELSSVNDRYLFRIADYRTAGDASPLDRVESAIRRVLYNQRKSEIIRWHEDSIYREAVRDGRIDMNVR